LPVTDWTAPPFRMQERTKMFQRRKVQKNLHYSNAM
jgi:hypothetical protein